MSLLTGASDRAVPPYDLAAWRQPLFEHGATGRWSGGQGLANGIHRFELAPDRSLDMLLSGIEHLRPGGCLLVGFTGAVPDRARKSAPFFSGISIAGRLRLPLLAVSDPVLALSSEVNLGWYAGLDGLSDLARRIGALVTEFALDHGVSPLLFGGSGGGFAALSVLGHTGTAARAMAWNPQTRLSRYSRRLVKAYADHAFGVAPPEVLASDAALAAHLDRCGIAHDLLRDRGPWTHPFLYLQNRTDLPHVEKHARPFLERYGARALSPHVFAMDDGGAIWFGDWGQGHVAPPAGLILSTLRALSREEAPDRLALALDAEHHDGAKGVDI